MIANSAYANEVIDLGEMPVENYQYHSRYSGKFLFGYVGGAQIHSERIIGNQSGLTVPFPVVGLNYEDSLFWNVTKGGAWIWKSPNQKLRFGPMLRLRLGESTNQDTQLAKLSKRKGSLEGGLGVAWFGYLKTSLEIYQDVSNRSDGASALLKVSRFIRVNSHISAIPFVALDWLSSDIVDYYYGVNADEANATGFTTYQGRSTTNSRIGVTLADHITRNWAVLGGVIYQLYGQGISRSPLVSKTGGTAFYMGFTYLFLKI